MLGTSILEYETRRNELYRQAAEYRLVKSLKDPNPWSQKLLSKVGKLMMESGQQLVNRYQTAESAQC